MILSFIYRWSFYVVVHMVFNGYIRTVCLVFLPRNTNKRLPGHIYVLLYKSEAQLIHNAFHHSKIGSSQFFKTDDPIQRMSKEQEGQSKRC